MRIIIPLNVIAAAILAFNVMAPHVDAQPPKADSAKPVATARPETVRDCPTDDGQSDPQNQRDADKQSLVADESPQHFEDDESLAELQSEIEESDRAVERLERRSRLASERLQLLKKAKGLRIEMLQAERRLDRLFEDDDEEAAAQVEPIIENLEIRLEETHARLALLESRSELEDLRVDLQEAGMEDAQREAGQLDRLHRHASEILGQIFQHFSDGRHEQGEQLEAELEAIETTFDFRREILQLKLELHWANEEQDEAAIKSLELELRSLRRSVGVPEETPRPSRDRADMPKPLRLDLAQVKAANTLSFGQHVEPLLRRHCHACHDDSASGDLNLISLANERPWVVQRDHWVNVIQQISVRSMPPRDSDPMPDEEREVIVAFLRNQLENFDYTSVQQPGFESARRLTRTEYSHTLRDLLGVDLDPASRFPRDLTASSGFENSANSLFIQPVVLERYLGAAEHVLQLALPNQAQTAQHRQVRKQIIGSGNAQEAIATFASRAFRRPIEEIELAALLRYYDELASSESNNSDDISIVALRQVLEVILTSPSFLIRSERNQSDTKRFRISNYELASRLSYFLWASMPDDRLFDLAAQGRLHEPSIMAAEVDRMIEDKRSNSLGTIFAGQWLGFHALPYVPRDPIDHPWATDSLVASMQQESATFFRSLIRNNEPVERLVDADYTFVNKELAKHYGLPTVAGSGLSRVSISATPRRGILGQGSILAITSFPNRTSPVVRGNWILSQLLGTPPPPPPPNVSEFDEQIADRDRLSQRQKLELHRDNPNCYACHSQIDPLGFALEQFDWFGRYRPQRQGRRVDARGQLPDGTEFEGLVGLQSSLLATQRDQLVRQMSRKMMSYALGRQLEYYDEATINQIIAKVQADDRRIRTMIQAIVASDAFQWKQLPDSTHQTPSQRRPNTNER
ncbi:MAG: DUF1592 domain-containing protein [Rubripirellula sp.]